MGYTIFYAEFFDEWALFSYTISNDFIAYLIHL
jgi:hypothetical protein